ncbi:MAG: S8 family serine peptidase [Thermoanaerobaculia bacterium]
MRRLFSLLVILIAGTAFAADSTPVRYLVTTRGPAPASRTEIRERYRDLQPWERKSLYFHPLHNIDGFIADMSPEDAAKLRAESGVVAVEPDHEVHILETSHPDGGPWIRPTPSTAAVTAESVTAQTVPYGILAIHADKLWSIANGAGIKVGIIDTGIDKTHPDLAAAFKGGYDFVDNDSDPNDENGHGTHVAGTIAAQNNAIGVVGVAPGAEIYSLRILGADGSGSISAEIKAIDWAISHGMNVINLSLGSPDSSVLEEQAFQRAYDAGVLAIAAAGNDGAQTLSYPGAYPTVVSVGAVDEKQALASFSNQGTDLKVVAPGVKVFSTMPVGSAEIASVASSGANISAAPFDGSPHGDATGPVVDCGEGKTTQIPASVRGKIALIARSNAIANMTFNEKVRNAVNAGAIGVIVADNIDEDINSRGWTLIRTDPATNKANQDDVTFPWPVTVFVSKSDGASLRASQGTDATVSAAPYDYGTLNGTSMATPHVAGTAALIWSLDPQAKAFEVRNAILSTASDLGAAGWDPSFGFGEIDALAAGKRLAPEKFPFTPRHRAAHP